MRPRERVGPFLSEHLGNTRLKSCYVFQLPDPSLIVLGPVLDMNLAPTFYVQQYPMLF